MIAQHNRKIIRVGGSLVNFMTGKGPVVPSYPPVGVDTIRVKWKTGGTYATPLDLWPTYGTQYSKWTDITCVDANENVWDLRRTNTKWNGYQDSSYVFHSFMEGAEIVEILDGDLRNMTELVGTFRDIGTLKTVKKLRTRDVTNCNAMFAFCTNLTSVPVFDTSLCENFSSMFYLCTKMTSIPQLDTQSAVNVYNIFSSCYKVESGILEMYNQMATQTIPPTTHERAFWNCGRDTVTGAAELAQIPSDWK